MWQERAWAAHEDRAMVFRKRATSTDRHWNGFEAILYEASAGFSEDQYVRYNVSMQVGRPLLVTSRCNGETLRRLQVPGDVKIVPPGVPRVWETESATVKLTMYLAPALMFSVADSMRIDPSRVVIPPNLHVRDPRIEHIGWAVKAEIESSQPLDRLYGDSLGVALASHLLRSYAPASDPMPHAKLSNRRLTRVCDYIRGNLSGDLSLQELATVAGLSASHFKTLFKQTIGMPVHQYVIRRRVEYAAELLQSGDPPLADVALQAGFSNQSHLARCMRRILGVTPASIRA
ncbi:MAG: helix-turn-helix transcriptional regulator [Candidatus Eremiobacteraeota bacterium]|nr:helix-turn-helix transcriptional regulator [Candidatus Eremiobacteraeota bacterium]